MKKVQFYFDTVSPFSYLAWHQIHKRITEVSDIEIEYRPVSLIRILKEHNIIPPISISAKKKYNQQDLMRFAKKYGILVKTPPKMPFLSFYSLKFFLAIEMVQQQKIFMDRVMKGIWLEQKDGANSTVIQEMAQEVGLDIKKLTQKAISIETKKKLDQNNTQAVEKGVFGVPSFTVKEELFFGNDRIDFVMEALSSMG